MKKGEKIESVWEIGGNTKNGTLILNDNIKLEIEAIKPFKGDRYFPYLHGKSRDGKEITIFEVAKTDYTLKNEKDMEVFKAKMAIFGGKFENKFENLTTHYCPKVFAEVSAPLWEEREGPYSFRLRIKGAELGCDFDFSKFLKPRLSISVKTKEPKSFEECYHRYIGTIERILSLIFCEVLEPQKFEEKIKNKKVEIYHPMRGPLEEKERSFEWTQPLPPVRWPILRKNTLQKIFKNVEKKFKKFMNLSSLYFWPFYFDDPDLELILYAGALEGYVKNFHKRRVRSLKEALEIILNNYLDLFTPEENGLKANLCKILNIDHHSSLSVIFKELFECFRITRNFIAHGLYPKKNQEDKIIHEPKHVHYVNWILRMILKALLLHQLGLEKEKIRGYVSREYHAINSLRFL